MPIYEYHCDACGNEFEEMQKFSDAPIDKCPRCGGHSRRLISQSTFVLKGTGWYVTDYANKGKGSGSSSDSD
jgi:putative FmdB family regulatory protein